MSHFLVDSGIWLLDGRSVIRFSQAKDHKRVFRRSCYFDSQTHHRIHFTNTNDVLFRCVRE